MNVIDLEILIPASPDFIWRSLGNISTAANWQEGLTAISFLTTQHEGKGTRWRSSGAKGNDMIVEATAWYDTLGYEYTIVDGGGFGNNQGRIRLLEVPDGTLVRWTFNYELGGVLGGIRNAMRLKRNTTKQIQASLRNLHKIVLHESGGIATREAKATVREAPDADERSIYQPRHPSAFADTAEDGMQDAYEDVAEIPGLEAERTAESASRSGQGDTKPNPVILSGDGLLDMDLQNDEIEAATQPIVSEIVKIESATEEEKVEQTTPPEPVMSSESTEAQAPAPPQRRAVDTSSVSVFEIFGLRKPSEVNDLPLSDSQPFRQRHKIDDIKPAAPGRQSDPIEEVNSPADMTPSASDLGILPSIDAPMESAKAQTAMHTKQSGLRKHSRRQSYRLRSHQ